MDEQPEERKPRFTNEAWKLVLIVGLVSGIALWSAIIPTTKGDLVLVCVMVAFIWFWVGYFCAPRRR